MFFVPVFSAYDKSIGVGTIINDVIPMLFGQIIEIERSLVVVSMPPSVPIIILKTKDPNG